MNTHIHSQPWYRSKSIEVEDGGVVVGGVYIYWNNDMSHAKKMDYVMLFYLEERKWNNCVISFQTKNFLKLSKRRTKW